MLLFICAFNFLAAQNVGVGNLNPSEKLDVAGNINLTGMLKANGTGGQVGQVLSSNGTALQWADMDEYKNTAQFNYEVSNQLWTVPPGVTKIMIEEWGGGGGAQTSTFYSAGSGAYLRSVIPAIPGSTVTISVGRGGLGYYLPAIGSASPGDNTVVTHNGYTLTAGGGSIYYLGGNFEVLPASFKNYIGFNGGLGQGITVNSWQYTTGVFRTYYFYGRGGDSPFAPPCGGGGGIGYENNSGTPNITALHQPGAGITPGGGGGAGWQRGGNGGNGLVIIHY